MRSRPERQKKPLIVHTRSSQGVTVRIVDNASIFEISLIEENIVTQSRVCYDLGKAIRTGNEMLQTELQKRRVDTLPL